jgi:replicative DNA helicase
MQRTRQELLVPPNDLEAERALLGCILLNPRVLDDLDGLRPAHFYWERHAKLFGHLVTIHEAGKPIDSKLLVEHLRLHGDLEAVGGADYIAELMGCVPYVHHARYYANIVKQKAARRALLETGHMLCREAYADRPSFDEVLDTAENALLRLGSDATEHRPFSAAEAAAEARRTLEEARYRQGTLGLPTGLATFDAHYGGLFPGELIVLAARTSVGKTAMAMQITTYNALAGRLVYFASCEMSASELLLRAACSLAGISLQAIRSGRASDAEHDRVEEALRELSSSALMVDDRPELSASSIRRETRRLVRKGLALIVVDYLQLLVPPDRKLQRYEQVGQMTAGLKALARDLGVPVLVLAQLSRAAESADEPKLSHLRESGSIEQDADVVLLLHRPEEGIEADGDTWAADLIVAKNRSGPTGRLRLDWDGVLMQFAVHQRQAYPEFVA